MTMGPDMVLGFVGGGNMAQAIATGILKKGLLKSNQIIVSAPSQCTLDEWEALSVETTNSNAEVILKADIIILAIKPHQLHSALDNLKFPTGEANLPSKLFVSVLAGITSGAIYSEIQNKVGLNMRLVRAMPNTLSTICEGCSAIAPHSTADSADANIVCEIFSAIGKCEVVPEYLFHAVTALSGSGPAYVYTIIEALSDGAVKQGLPRELATTFAAQTVLGAGKMVLETKKHTGQLKDEVCSAGGTTIHGLHALEKGQLRATLMNAVEAATKRSEEMSK